MDVNTNTLFNLAGVGALGVVGFLFSNFFKNFAESITKLSGCIENHTEELASFRTEVALFRQRLEAIESEVRSLRRPTL